MALYGADVSVPISVEPLKNSTFEIVPVLLVADAFTVIVAGAVNALPADGDVNATFGGAGGVGTLAGVITTLTDGDCVVAPALSVATAFRAYVPA